MKTKDLNFSVWRYVAIKFPEAIWMTVQLSLETVQEIWQDIKKKISNSHNCRGGNPSLINIASA